MVVFVDFEADGSEKDPVAFRHAYFLARNGSPLDHFDDDVLARRLSGSAFGGSKNAGVHTQSNDEQVQDQVPEQSSQPDSTVNGYCVLNHVSDGFAAALGCYPVVKSLTQWLDLNTLFSLSLTCRQFRANLLQFRAQLVRQTLRCDGEKKPLLSDVIDGNGSGQTVSLEHTLRRNIEVRDDMMLLAPKIGKCARDLVGECRRCGSVVCRNCTIKPPSNSMLRNRYRRICTQCLEVPLYKHTIPPSSMARRGSDESTYSLSRPRSSSSYESYESVDNEHFNQGSDIQLDCFTASAFSRSPCMCATRGVWLCQPCGQGLKAADITYKRVWTWRSRYSTHIGGLGTGMGEGNQGQKCGRGDQCLAGKDIEVEIDCSAEEADEPLFHQRNHSQSFPFSIDSYNHLHTHHDLSPAATMTTSLVVPPSRRSSTDQSPGYFRQEIEGIGGVVKKKVKKRVRVGATVTEYEDERETGKYLEREAEGINRSWCGWCSRVVPGTDDLKYNDNDDDDDEDAQNNNGGSRGGNNALTERKIGFTPYPRT